MSKQSLKIESMKISDLVPYRNNPRKNDASVDLVAASIDEFGFKVPIVVDSKGEIVTGHTRLKAAKKLGLGEVPVIVADDLSEDQIKAFRLADNKTSEASEWDFNLLALELDGLDCFDMELFGFTDMSISDTFSDDFSLKDGDKDSIGQATFPLSEEQRVYVLSVLDSVNPSDIPTFGNPSKRGNALYKVVKEWAGH